MASVVPINNQEDPGTGVLYDGKAARIATSLIKRIARQRPENEARWRAASISCNFRAGSYDGTSYPSTPSLVRDKTEFVCNIIDRKCLWISGYQRQNRKDFELTALNDEYSRVCDQRNKVLKYFSNKNQMADLFSEACDGALTEGLVLVEPYMKPSALFGCNPCLHVWHACDFIIDTYFRNGDLSDCSYIATSQILSAQEAECLFPWADPEVFYSGKLITNPFYFQPASKSYPKQQDICQIVRLWTRAVMTKNYAVNGQTGEMIPLRKKLSSVELYEVSRQANAPIEQRSIKEVGWQLSIMVNGHPIQNDVVNPLGFNECPMVPLFWRHNPTAQSVALRFPSLPAQLQDAQYLSDRRICMTHDILEARAQSGWLVPKGSLDNNDILLAHQNASIIEFDAEIGAPVPIPPSVVPPTTLEMIEQLRRFADEASPIGENLMGVNPQEGQSGVKTMLEQAAGLVGMRPIFDGWDRALRLVGNLVDKIIVNNISTQEAQMILGAQDPLDPKFFNVHEGAASMQVTEGLYTDSQKKTQFNQWLEFTQLTGIQLPPEAWAKIAPLQKSDEILALLAQQQQAASQQAQQAQEYELAIARAKVAQTNADALDKVAMARERDARAQSNIGLQDERESEINRNNAVYAKNIVEALATLMEAKATFAPQLQKQSAAELQQVRESIDLSNQQRIAAVDERANDMSALTQDQQVVGQLSEVTPNE